MKRISRLLVLFGLAIGLIVSPVLLASSSQTAAQTSKSTNLGIEKRGTYETVACSRLFAPAEGEDSAANQSPIPDYGDIAEGTDYECGYLAVPEVYNQPDGKTIQVGIVTIKSTHPNPAEPLVVFQGGPGGSSIALFPSLFLPLNETNQPILAERDVIIFEKRGNRYSQPYLNCPGYQEDNVNFTPAATDKALSRLAACRDRLVAAGINLEAFNSQESAHDVAALASALGYEQLNLYGVSYGTELAQDVLRFHPELVRSVILDGVVPGNPSVDSQYAVILDRLITQVDAACTADADCNALYPNVKGTFEATVERLNATPATVELITANGIEKQPVTGLNLAHAIFEMSYSSGAPFVIPAMIYQASEDEFGIIIQQRYLHGEGSGMAMGTYYSVKCSEDIAYTDGLDSAGVAPFAAEWGGFMLDFMEDACAVWDVPALDASVRDAVVSDTPALIFNGQFDPITPPPFGAQVAQGFSNQTTVVFPANGHGAITGGACPLSIMAEFLNNPDQPPDTQCASEGKIEFVTDKNTLIAPGTAWLSQSLFDLNLAVLIQRLLLLIILILFPLLWLLLWFIDRRHRADKTASVPLGAKLSPWLGVLLALLSIAWLGAQAYALEMTTVLNTPNFFLGFNRVLVGIDRSFAWIYLIPIAIALVSIAMVCLAVIAWRNHYWDKRRRFYYAFTAGVAIAYTLFLASAGQLTVFL